MSSLRVRWNRQIARLRYQHSDFVYCHYFRIFCDWCPDIPFPYSAQSSFQSKPLIMTASSSSVITSPPGWLKSTSRGKCFGSKAFTMRVGSPSGSSSTAITSTMLNDSISICGFLCVAFCYYGHHFNSVFVSASRIENSLWGLFEFDHFGGIPAGQESDELIWVLTWAKSSPCYHCLNHRPLPILSFFPHSDSTGKFSTDSGVYIDWTLAWLAISFALQTSWINNAKVHLTYQFPITLQQIQLYRHWHWLW